MKPVYTHQTETERRIENHPDPSGTDPNRYDSGSEVISLSECADEYDRMQSPDNHPSTDDVMFNPNRG